MICNGYSAEDYGMFTLSLLEEPIAAEIRNHLANRCETCTSEVRTNSAIWYLYGLANVADDGVMPSRALRRRILEIPRGGSNVVTLRPKPFSWSWAPPLAAGVLIGAVSWYGWEAGHRRPLTPLQVPLTALAPNLQELAQLRQRAEQAEQQLQALRSAPPAVAPAPAVSSAPAPAAPPPESLQALATARAENQTLATTLAQERARATALENDLTTQRQLLAAEQQKQAAASTDTSTRLQASENRVATLTARVQQLERENTGYREVVDRLERQYDRSTRLVAFLASPSLKLVQLQPTEAARRAVGHAFVVEGQKVLFYADNLPQLPAGRTYQLWILSSKGPGPGIISGGIGRPDASQRLMIEFENGTQVSQIRGLAITEEPGGGSPGPTGHKILVGTVRS